MVNTKVFILPDGKQVRPESGLVTVSRKMGRVQPATTKRDDDGNETIAKPARNLIEKQDFNTTYAALAGMTARERELFSVTIAEDSPAPDPLFFTHTDGPVKNGVATRKITPRPLANVKAMLTATVRAHTAAAITERFSQSDQLNDTARRAELAEKLATVGNLTEKEASEQKTLRANRMWIEGVLAHGRALQKQVAGLKTVEAAAKYKPGGWPA